MVRGRGVLAMLVQVQRENERDRQRRAVAAARAQRAAERAAAARSRMRQQDLKVRDRLYAEARVAEAADETELIERQVQALESVLAATLGVDDYLDLEVLKAPPHVPAFAPAAAGIIPPEPRLETFLPAAPSGFGRVFGGAKHAEQAQQQQRAYQSAVEAHQLEVHRYEERLENLRQQHAAHCAQLLQEHRQHVAEITALQRRLAARDPEAVIQYLDLVLEAAKYPDGFPHRWRLAYSPGSAQLVVEHELPPPGVVPEAKAYKYVKSSDTISPVSRPVTQARALYVQVIMQTALRVVHEVLEADRGGLIRTIVYNGHVSGLDPATGRPTRPCVLALATSRDRFLALDLARVDPAACLDHLEARISKDPSKLKGIEPLVLSGTLDFAHGIDTDETEPANPAADLPDGAGQPSTASSVRNRLELTAGQNVQLEQGRVHVTLPTAGADLSILLLDASGHVARDEDFIFYNNPRSSDGAVELHGGRSPDSATVDLSRLAQRYERLVLVASADDGNAPVSEASLVVRQQDPGPDLSFRSGDTTHVSALVCGELYRRAGAWRLRAVGQGWRDGLTGLAREYGVDVS